MNKSVAVVTVLALWSPLGATPHKAREVSFEQVLGMPIITVHTSQGKRRFVLDTGSSISTMDLNREQELRLSVAGKQFTVRFIPTQTPVFHQFEALLPPSQHVDGILGSDFMRHFERVTFDFNNGLVSFE